tara:strand:- start:2027 stop:2848 length:822 start_codon:yes stop_codon:yes gene_type:complete
MIIWIASYPKSGNTWMRALLSTYLYLKGDNFNFKLLSKIPNFTRDKYFENFVDLNLLKKEPLKISEYWNTAQARINLQDEEKIFKTHSACVSLQDKWFTTKTHTSGYIHIVRDPRAVVCSLAAHSNTTLEKSLKDLLDDNFFGLNGKYGLAEITCSWRINYLSWKKKKDFPGILIKYEDLFDNTEKEFRKVLDFLKDKLNFEIDDEKIRQTVRLCNFSKLSDKEDKDGFVEQVNGKFFRKGKKDSWKKELSLSIKNEIEDKLKNEMKELGYLN